MIGLGPEPGLLIARQSPSCLELLSPGLRDNQSALAVGLGAAEAYMYRIPIGSESPRQAALKLHGNEFIQESWRVGIGKAPSLLGRVMGPRRMVLLFICTVLAG